MKGTGSTILIIEGADLTGKTTMARAAKSALDGPRFGLPHGSERLSRLPETHDQFRDYLRLMRPDVIYDRFHLSELAYRSQDDYPSVVTPGRVRLVEAGIAAAAAGFVVVLTADDEAIEERYASLPGGRMEMYPLEHILRVNQAFRQIEQDGATELRGNHYKLRIDAAVDTSSFDHMEDTLDAILREYAERFCEWRVLTGGIVGSGT